MSALLFGLTAAMAWGVHDLCVRYVSQQTQIFSALLTVLVSGAIIQSAYMGISGQFAAVSGTALSLSLAAGVVYGLTCLGYYRAFSIGPVRLVAPIVAAFPIFSVAWAALSGKPIAPYEWLAVLAVTGGISLVAILSHDKTEMHHAKRSAIFWACVGALGFAATFAIGQKAAESAPEIPSVLITRLAAIGTLVVVMLIMRRPYEMARNQVPLLAIMGGLDALALVCVLSAGTLADAQYASVAASIFGIITILLAWIILREKMTLGQWTGVLVCFSGIAYLAL